MALQDAPDIKHIARAIEESGQYSPNKFMFNDKQLEASRLITGTQRHTQLEGGARSGKTFFFTRAVLHRARIAPGSRHVILRFRGNAVRSSIGEDTLPKVCATCFPGLVLAPHKQSGFFELPNTSQIWLGGLDEKERVEKILGQEFATMYFNETSQIPYSSIVIALTRLAQQCVTLNKTPLRQKAFYDLNPPPKGHWSYQLFHNLIDPATKKPVYDPENYKYMRINPIDNLANLSTEYIASLKNLPERQKKRFFEGIYTDDTDTALWTLESIERARVQPHQVPPMQQIVVAVDPSGAENEMDFKHDEIGIVVVGIGVDGHGYIMKDLSLLAGPQKWGEVAVTAYHGERADRIVGEINFGGAMVKNTLHTIDNGVPFKEVTASRGKHLRAEPVASLMSQIRLHIVGYMPEMEDEMVGFTTDGYIGQNSPNRADAMIHGVTDLMINDKAQMWIDHYAKLAQEAHDPNLHKALAPTTGKYSSVPVDKGNDITRAYNAAMASIHKPVTLCDRCHTPIKFGQSKVTDGFTNYHSAGECPLE